MSHQAAIREEELKNRVAAMFFGKYDCTHTAHKALAAQIEPKVYEYGFLKR